MKALHFYSHGWLENLKFGEIQTPRPKAKEVVVKVGASAINHLDLWVLKGWPGLKLPMPHVGGADIAGEIVELGAGVEKWKLGTRVVVNPGYIDPGADDEWIRRGEESVSPHYHMFGEGRAGGFAELVCIPEQCLFEMPPDLSYVDAAAPLLVGVTAWRMLITRAQLKSGQSVLIVGAGGGLNSFTLQLAKSLGAKVIALTSSEEKMTQASELGADHVLNYRRNPDWSRLVREMTSGQGVDVVVDNVGEKTFQQSILSTKRGGCVVTVGNTSGPHIAIDNRLLFTRQISILGSTMGSNKDFREAVQALWGKKLKPVIHCTIALPEGREAYELLSRGEQFGKVVLVP